MRDIEKLRQFGRIDLRRIKSAVSRHAWCVLLVKQSNDAESLSATLFAEAQIWRFETLSRSSDLELFSTDTKPTTLSRDVNNSV